MMQRYFEMAEFKSFHEPDLHTWKVTANKSMVAFESSSAHIAK
jgi:hypothetical protein